MTAAAVDVEPRPPGCGPDRRRARPDWPYATPLARADPRAAGARWAIPSAGSPSSTSPARRARAARRCFAESILRAPGRASAPSPRRTSSAGPSASASTAPRSRARTWPRPSPGAARTSRRCARRTRAAPTFFDATTAAALLAVPRGAASTASCSRWASAAGSIPPTSCEPAVACVTSIELEHTDRLGDTLAAIAGEKAGILKPGVPAVVGALPERGAGGRRCAARARSARRSPGSAWTSGARCSAKISTAAGRAVRRTARPRGAACPCSARSGGQRRARARLRPARAGSRTPCSRPRRRGARRASACPGASRCSRARPGSWSTPHTRPPRRARWRTCSSARRAGAPSGALDLGGQGHGRDPRRAAAAARTK